MKKIVKYILSAAVVLLSLSACDKILDSESPSAFDAATVYSNYALTEGTIFGITEAFCEVNSYRGRFLPWSLQRSFPAHVYGHRTGEPGH